METEMRSLIRSIHAANASSGRRLVLFIAGGGFSGVSSLLSEPNASSSILEARALYAREAVINTLGSGTQLSSFASRGAALELARAAFAHAQTLLCNSTHSAEGDFSGRKLRGGGGGVVGIGAAGAIASVPIRRGEHRIILARADGYSESVIEINFGKGFRERSDEEMLAGSALIGFVSGNGVKVGLDALLDSSSGSGMGGLLKFGDAEGDFLTNEETAVLTPPLTSLLMRSSVNEMRKDGDDDDNNDTNMRDIVGSGPLVTHILYDSESDDGSGGGNGTKRVMRNANLPKGALLLSGSFNPPHAGHRLLLQAAAARLSADRGGVKVWSAFELSAENVDKPTLTAADVEQRVAWLQGGEGGDNSSSSTGSSSSGGGPGAHLTSPSSSTPVIVTRAPLFAQKATLFPGTSFAMGFDTAARLVESRYYIGGTNGMITALARLRDTGTRVYVAGRRIAPDLGFLTLKKDLLPKIPTSLWSLFEEISEEECRADVSSSEIRHILQKKEL